MVLEFCPGGELFLHLLKKRRFSETNARIIIAEIILALEHLHKENIIYRDLKPENVLVDLDGHIKLTDFGLCRLNFTKEDLSKSLCGSPEYMCPEMLESGTHSTTIDFYQVGVFLFELLTGLPPNFSKDKKEMFMNIINKNADIPKWLTPEVTNLLQLLLTKDPSKRLGCEMGWEDIKQHAFFTSCPGFDWGKVLAK